MLRINRIHHTAIICSDYEKSKHFYTEVLGFTLIAEHYREERQSWKADLALNTEYAIELFSFPNPPQRLSRPEAAGLRHLAFEVDDIELAIAHLDSNGIVAEPLRIDGYTGRRFTFFTDPDDLPLELYER